MSGIFRVEMFYIIDFIITHRAGYNNVLLCFEIFRIIFCNFFFVVLIVLFLRFLV